MLMHYGPDQVSDVHEALFYFAAHLDTSYVSSIFDALRTLLSGRRRLPPGIAAAEDAVSGGGGGASAVAEGDGTTVAVSAAGSGASTTTVVAGDAGAGPVVRLGSGDRPLASSDASAEAAKPAKLARTKSDGGCEV